MNELYDVIFCNDSRWYDYFYRVHCVAASLTSLEAAKDARQQSGDVVVYHGSRDVVKSGAWLWDWERKDPNSYARKKISQ